MQNYPYITKNDYGTTLHADPNMDVYFHNKRPDLVEHQNFKSLRSSIRASRAYPVTNTGTAIGLFIPR